MNSAWNRLTKKREKRKKTLQYDAVEITSNTQELSLYLDENIKKIRESLGNSGDLVVRDFKMGKPFLHKVASIYINGLTDKEIMGSFIIERLMNDVHMVESDESCLPSQLGIYIKAIF